jgi:hypothetical protein
MKWPGPSGRMVQTRGKKQRMVVDKTGKERLGCRPRMGRPHCQFSGKMPSKTAKFSPLIPLFMGVQLAGESTASKCHRPCSPFVGPEATGQPPNLLAEPHPTISLPSHALGSA